jgi:acyl carrier protein
MAIPPDEISAYLVRHHAPHLEAGQMASRSLLRDGILQSIDVVDLVLYLEKQYGVKIPSAEVVPENFDSVAAICRLLESLAPVSA